MTAIDRAIFAIPTPFDQRFELAERALAAHLDLLDSLGAPPVVLNGTTGEFPSLTTAERKRVVEIAAGYRGKIYNHIGSCSVVEALDLLRHSEQRADASLVVSPFYFAAPTERGLHDYFASIARAATKPVFLYDFPKHARVSLAPDFVAALAAEWPMVQGIKCSGGGLSDAEPFKPHVANVFVANESSAADALRNGFAGVIAGGANPLPEYLLTLADAVASNDEPLAVKVMSDYESWNNFRRAAGADALAVIKAAMSARIEGYPPFVRPPLVALDEAMQSRVRAEIAERVTRLRARFFAQS